MTEVLFVYHRNDLWEKYNEELEQLEVNVANFTVRIVVQYTGLRHPMWATSTFGLVNSYLNGHTM